MKIPVIFLLNIIVLLQTFPKSIYIIDYHINQEKYIAYCINQDKPEMHCDGSCYLHKKMNDEDQDKPETAQDFFRSMINVYVFSSFTEIIPMVKLLKPTLKISIPENLTPKNLPNSIFKPPQHT